MDVVEAILARHSVRGFKPDPVKKETILKILEAATRSPSSGNSQPWQIFVAGGGVLEKVRQSYFERFEKDVPGKPEITGTPPNQWPTALQERMAAQRAERNKLLGIGPEDKAALRADMGKGSKFFGAPVLVVLCMERALSEASVFDIGLLSQTIMLAAQNFGLGSVIARSFVNHPDILRQELAIPDSLLIVIAIALGYQDDKSIINTYRSSRRPIQEAVTFKGL
jgi:nitroreductase